MGFARASRRAGRQICGIFRNPIKNQCSRDGELFSFIVAGCVLCRNIRNFISIFNLVSTLGHGERRSGGWLDGSIWKWVSSRTLSAMLVTNANFLPVGNPNRSSCSVKSASRRSRRHRPPPHFKRAWRSRCSRDRTNERRAAGGQRPLRWWRVTSSSSSISVGTTATRRSSHRIDCVWRTPTRRSTTKPSSDSRFKCPRSFANMPNPKVFTRSFRSHAVLGRVATMPSKASSSWCRGKSPLRSAPWWCTTCTFAISRKKCSSWRRQKKPPAN